MIKRMGFLERGVPHEKVVIHELLVSDGSMIVKRDTFEGTHRINILEHTP